MRAAKAREEAEANRDFIWVRKSDYSKALIAEALRHLTNHRRWEERMRK